MIGKELFRRCFYRQRGFKKDQSGATAVEFAMVALPFFAFIFAILETAMSFWSQQVLETAVADAARQVYTGEFQKKITSDQAASGKTMTSAEVATRFQNLVCAKVTAVFSCSNVKFDIRSVSNFPTSSLPLPVNSARQLDTSSWQVTQPPQNSIVVVRAALEYPTLIPTLKLSGGTLANGNKLIMATAAFMTEPY